MYLAYLLQSPGGQPDVYDYPLVQQEQESNNQLMTARRIQDADFEKLLLLYEHLHEQDRNAPVEHLQKD